MTIKPFIDKNTAVDEYTPTYTERGLTVPGAFGLFMPSGWCVVGVCVYAGNVGLIVCNIAVGLWNDPD